jgi:hypothetical protein
MEAIHGSKQHRIKAHEKYHYHRKAGLLCFDDAEKELAAIMIIDESGNIPMLPGAFAQLCLFTSLAAFDFHRLLDLSSPTMGRGKISVMTAHPAGAAEKSFSQIKSCGREIINAKMGPPDNRSSLRYRPGNRCRPNEKS